MIKERKIKIAEANPISENDTTSRLDEIRKAKELLDMGAISEDEFQEIKNSYIKQL